MNRQNKLFLFLLIFLTFTLFTVAQGRQQFQMNSDWAYHKGDVAGGERVDLNDSDWEAVAIPHILQLEKKHCGGNRIYQGMGWYRRYFILDSSYVGKRITVDFEGVMKSCEVYLNGRQVGAHAGGYLGFSIDLSPYVRWNENNLLAVKVTSVNDALIPPGKPQEKMDFYYYSGIYRDVTLTITDRLHITDALDDGFAVSGGVFVTYPTVTPQQAVVNVKTHVANRGTDVRQVVLHNILLDDQGRQIGTVQSALSLKGGADETVEQQMTFENPTLWSIDTPYLYTLRTELRDAANDEPVDAVEQQVGVRSIAFTREDGFFLNGENIFLNGTNRHQAFPNVGDAASNSMQERDARAIKRAGFNAVRAAHYPHDEAFLAACDRVGLVVIECITGWQFYTGDSLFNARLQDVDRYMVRRDRNHPCVVCWETALNESSYPVEVAKKLYDIVHEEYPGEQTYTSGDYLGSEDKKDYFDVLYKQVSRYPKDGNVMSNYPEDMISIKPLFTREWGDGVGLKPRVSLMENEEELAKQCVGRYDALMGNGYFDWCMLDANPSLGGHFLWCYADFARGCEDETEYCGVVDMNRYPKFSYYMTQSMMKPVKGEKGLYPGPMVHIASYNSGEPFVTCSRQVWVFSNCDAVILYRNGEMMGAKTYNEEGKKFRALLSKGANPCYAFKIDGYEAGELRAEGLIDGKVVARHIVTTAGRAARIEVMPFADGVRPVADGSDMVPVYFRILDSKGNLVTDADNMIHLTVSGEGKLIGARNDSVAIEHQRVEGGIGFAFVRTTKKAGKVTVTATGDGLKRGRASFKTYRSTALLLPDGSHAPFTGHEVYLPVDPQWKKEVLKHEKIAIQSIEVTTEHKDYPKQNLTDGSDRTWWLAASPLFPQTVTLALGSAEWVEAVRIAFQKDSSYYRHKVETSTDGQSWELLYETECTGFDFEPRPVNRSLKYLRITVTSANAGVAGIGEVTLFGTSD